MGQDAGIHSRVACLSRDTTVMLSWPLAGARTAGLEARRPHNTKAKARLSLACNVHLSSLEGNEH
jgi:hypothetical protein